MTRDPLEELGVEQLRGHGRLKWDRAEDGVLGAWLADADAPLCPPVRAAIDDLLDAGNLVYPADELRDDVVACFVARQSSRHRWRPDPDRVVLAGEAIQVVSAVVERCTAPGEPVAVHTPAYPPILHEIDVLGRRRRPLRWELVDGRWTVDPAAVDAAAAEGTRLLVLVNPHNPTGRVWRRQELAALAESVVRHDLVVIADELHADLVHDDGVDGGTVHVPFASLDDEVAARTVTLSAASKSHNLAGAKCLVAHVGASPRLDAVRAMTPGRLGAVSNVGLVATAAAWRDGDEWLASFVAAVDERRHRLASALETYLPEVVAPRPEASFLAWLDCRDLGLPAEPVDFFRDRARVALGSGPSFGEGGEGRVRLTLAASTAVLDEIVERMVTAVDLWRADLA